MVLHLKDSINISQVNMLCYYFFSKPYTDLPGQVWSSAAGLCLGLNATQTGFFCRFCVAALLLVFWFNMLLCLKWLPRPNGSWSLNWWAAKENDLKFEEILNPSSVTILLSVIMIMITIQIQQQFDSERLGKDSMHHKDINVDHGSIQFD